MGGGEGDLLLSLPLDSHLIITGSFEDNMIFWKGLQPGNGPFQEYFGVAVEELWKEKEERVYFSGNFLRIYLFELALHLRIWGLRMEM